MKHIFLILILTFLPCFAYQSKVYNVQALGIYDAVHSEKIIHSLKTKYNYNGVCYVTVFLKGHLSQHKIFVSIGNAIGDYQSRKLISNKSKIVVGEVQLFKFDSVKSGKIEIKVNQKTYEKRVYVK